MTKNENPNQRNHRKRKPQMARETSQNRKIPQRITWNRHSNNNTEKCRCTAMIDPAHKELKQNWQTLEEYEQWLKNNTYKKANSDQKTQGKTTNPNDNQQKNIEKLQSVKTGLPRHETRWARAPNSRVRESSTERSACSNNEVEC